MSQLPPSNHVQTNPSLPDPHPPSTSEPPPPPPTLQLEPPSSPPPSSSVASHAVSEEELQTCLKVLDAISSMPDWQSAPKLRPFRKRLLSFSSLTDSILDKRERQQQLRLKAKLRKTEERQRGRSLHLRSAMFALRVEKLRQSGLHGMLPPDGPALDPEEQLHLLLAPEQAQRPPSLLDGPDPSEPPLACPSPPHTQSNQAFPYPLSSISQQNLSNPETLLRPSPRKCYTCKQSYDFQHHFYHSLCPACGDLNFAKRHQTANLQGKTALVTGGRIKIGFYCALMLLRAGAHVIVTTRFPQDATARFLAEPDAGLWRDRLQLCSLDFREIPAVEAFAQFLSRSLPRLDILINNACQTLHRPPAFYQHLLKAEQVVPSEPKILRLQQNFLATTKLIAPLDPLPSKLSSFTTLPLLPEDDPSQNPSLTASFPEDCLDVQGQQVDLRSSNSWVLPPSEVQTPELLEVLSINTCAPFILTSRLKALMASSGSPAELKYVINVSAMEGCFTTFKSGNHVHTNLAKAALNMMTRSCAQAFMQAGIFMAAVDTGWVNDERPFLKALEAFQKEAFQTPLDEIDGAARILDPIFQGVLGCQMVAGLFYKDYFPHPW